MATSDMPETEQVSNHAEDGPENEPEVTLSPEEAATLLAESQSLKDHANALFLSHAYTPALSTYQDALTTLPPGAHYHAAVLHSNMAACHVKLQSWSDAIAAATSSLDSLAKMSNSEQQTDEKGGNQQQMQDTKMEGQQNEDVLRIRAKALLRRARARSEAGGWANLSGAEEDYRTLSAMTLTEGDERTVRTQLSVLPGRVKQAQEREVGEMWGKLKGLGNSILKPFGLSTDNFQMVPDDKGGYSMNFSQGR